MSDSIIINNGAYYGRIAEKTSEIVRPGLNQAGSKQKEDNERIL
jgi:hypothetical protein